MDRYDDPTAVAVLPALPAAATPGYSTDGDETIPTPPTNLRAWFINALQEEIRNVIVAAGITPNRAVWTQLRDAINDLIGAGMLSPFLNHTSAATCDIGAAVSGMTSPNANITGTTTITSLGSSASASRPLYVITFGGILQLTHNAVSLILPGAANIITAAGDAALAKYLGSGNWQILSYFPANPIPVQSIYREWVTFDKNGTIAAQFSWRPGVTFTVSGTNSDFTITPSVPFPSAVVNPAGCSVQNSTQRFCGWGVKGRTVVASTTTSMEMYMGFDTTNGAQEDSDGYIFVGFVY